MTARTTRSSLTGTFDGLDPNGALILDTAKGPVTVDAADVFF